MGNMLRGSERQLVASMSLCRGEAQRRTGSRVQLTNCDSCSRCTFREYLTCYLFRNMYFINRFRRCFTVSGWNSLDLLEFGVKPQPFCNPLIKRPLRTFFNQNRFFFLIGLMFPWKPYSLPACFIRLHLTRGIRDDALASPLLKEEESEWQRCNFSGNLKLTRVGGSLSSYLPWISGLVDFSCIAKYYTWSSDRHRKMKISFVIQIAVVLQLQFSPAQVECLISVGFSKLKCMYRRVIFNNPPMTTRHMCQAYIIYIWLLDIYRY